MRVDFLTLSIVSTLLLFPTSGYAKESQLDSYCHDVKQDQFKVKYVVLSKDGHDTRPPNIILSFANQWEGILNPTHKAYPITKSLKGMTEAEAKELFGKPIRTDGQKSYFELLMINPNQNIAKPDTVEIEMEFKDGLISSYAVHGDLIGERDKRYPNFVGLYNGGEEHGPKITALLQEYRRKHGKDMPADERPYLVLVGRSRHGCSLYDIPEQGQYRSKFLDRRSKESNN